MEVKYKAFYLSLDIIKFLESLPRSQAIRIISEQLIRCITSIGANIVEAKGSSSKRDFLNYFHIALKSTHEAAYWLALLREIAKEKREVIDTFLKEVEEIRKILSSSILTMKGKRKL